MIKKGVIIAVILFCNIFLYAQQTTKSNFTLTEVVKNQEFTQNTIDGLVSMNDGIHYTVIEGDTAIVKYSYATGERVSVIMSVSELNDLRISGFDNYTFNKDETKLIFYVNRERIYRRSFYAQFYVWDILSKSLYQVSDKKEQQLATLSPNGKQVAFAYKNNLYISDLETNSEMQITTDGEFNKIINGVPDWVYEEEFEYNQAFSWSPDGMFIAYCKWDESQVPIFNMTVYAGQHPKKSGNELYPENYSFKYPKAGEVNSIVTVYAYNIKSKETIEVSTGENTDQYIPRLLWSPKNEIIYYRLNRLQNHLEFVKADPKSGDTKVFYNEKNEKYIDEVYFDYLTFVENGDKFIYASEQSGFLHLYLYNTKGEEIQQLTNGSWDVTDYYGFDKKKSIIYYQSAESSPLNREVFSVNIKTKKKKQLTKQEGTNRAIFSSTFNYFINYFSNANTPTLVTLNNSSGKQLRVLEDNKELTEKINAKNFSQKEFFSFENAEGISLNGWMVKPVNFDPTKEYPLLMTQYSGPNSQSVSNSFNVGWEQVLAGEGYVVACVDGRGTAARGEEFRKITYLQLGKYETIDQIEAAKYLGSLNYIDAARIGIWGWSYGGFMSLNCLMQGANYFKLGIAVAPVTNWRYYDNIYTERFMRIPAENADGYDNNSPIFHVDKLKGKLLLVHGTSDDNVHLQNSLELSEALVQANKQFEMFYYTNRNHSIYGGNTRFHLYSKKLNFIKQNL